MPWDWDKEDYFELARLANHESSELVKLKVNPNDLVADNRLDELVEAIYEAMREAGIDYALEPVPRSGSGTEALVYQSVRLPHEIMRTNKREGTCLDLALFFSGVCLGYQLLPMLIALGDPEGQEDNRHVLVAVSRTHDLRAWESQTLSDISILVKIPIGSEHADEICQFILKERYVPVECTGFARGKKFAPEFPEGSGREPDGTMPYESAKRAGLAHFNGLKEEGLSPAKKPSERKFLFAINYGGVYHYRTKLRPVDELDAGGRSISRFQNEQPDGRAPEADPLRYIINRVEQEDALKDAVLKYQVCAPKRPLVCVIHGDEAECHDNFVTRLERVSLPKILSFFRPMSDAENVIMRRKMEPSLGRLTEENWRSVLWGDLSAALLNGNRDASPDSVVDHISRRKPAVMIDVQLWSEEIDGVPLERLDYFFKFWGTLPPLPEDLLLIVCLSLKYQSAYERTWLRFWGSLNDRLRRYVGELKFGRFGEVEGVCLPMLEPIKQTDATKAVKHKLVEGRGLFEDDVIRVYRESRRRDSKGRIPMIDLIHQLGRPIQAA